MPPSDPAPGARPPGLEALGDRFRLRFAKQGKIRFTSHRDVARMWERALRRSALPVAWSEGFSPRPLLSFGLALPTGCESLAEYVDVRLDGDPGDPGGPQDPVWPALGALLGPLLPEGISIQAAGPIEVGTGSLQQEVTSCSWELEFEGLGHRELAERVEILLGSPSIVIRRERKGRQVDDDLRPSVLALETVTGPSGAPPGESRTRLRAQLATQPRGVRPAELLDGLGGGLTLALACRTHQWIERDGTRWEPLAVRRWAPVPSDRHAPPVERAT